MVKRTDTWVRPYGAIRHLLPAFPSKIANQKSKTETLLASIGYTQNLHFLSFT
jgi:hypothetical protein